MLFRHHHTRAAATSRVQSREAVEAGLSGDVIANGAQGRRVAIRSRKFGETYGALASQSAGKLAEYRSRRDRREFRARRVRGGAGA